MIAYILILLQWKRGSEMGRKREGGGKETVMGRRRGKEREKREFLTFPSCLLSVMPFHSAYRVKMSPSVSGTSNFVGKVRNGSLMSWSQQPRSHHTEPDTIAFWYGVCGYVEENGGHMVEAGCLGLGRGWHLTGARVCTAAGHSAWCGPTTTIPRAASYRLVKDATEWWQETSRGIGASPTSGSRKKNPKENVQPNRFPCDLDSSSFGSPLTGGGWQQQVFRYHLNQTGWPG